MTQGSECISNIRYPVSFISPMSVLKKLYWCLFVWRIPYARDEELKNVDAIVTQAVSKLKDGSSGPGDELLADAVERIRKTYPDMPVLAQDVVAHVLQQRGISCVSIAKPQEESYGHSSFHWNTYTVALKQFELCKQKSWKRIALVAMPDHVVRSFMVYNNVGFKDVRVIAVDPIQTHYHHPKCLYWSMRGDRWRFVLRELGCRLLFLFTGRL